MSTTLSGVMLSLNHFGVLLQGESGSGKSELALALLDRGHQLVSDDAVELHNEQDRLIARAPIPLRGFLGIRHIGIIQVEQHFGLNAICSEQSVDLIIHLQQNAINNNPLPTTWPHQMLLGYPIPAISLAQQGATHLALLVETAVKQAQSGHCSTPAFICSTEVIRHII